VTRSVSRALRLVYLTGSRADYAPMRPVLRKLAAERWVDLSILVTGMHLLPRFGRTDRLIVRDGHPVAARVRLPGRGDSAGSMGRDMGAAIAGITTALERLRPGALFVHGDRDEALAGAIAARHLSIPVVDFGGGDVSGSIDDANRNATSHFATLHLAGTHAAVARLRTLGADPDSIKYVGEPGLDYLIARRRHRPARVAPFILLSQHPVVGEPGADQQLRATIAALERVGLPVVASYPNSDAGGRGMIRELDRAAKRHPSWRVMASAPSADAYYDLLLSAAVMVGNSSAALIEAPSAGLPAVNIGSRQHGRRRARNVVDAGYGTAAIEAAVRRQVRVAAARRGRPYANPYGDGRAADRVVAAIHAWWTRPAAR
jgi:GDP/UDP-N,N'-diacetylbacillosamine 2-epimerase (hydrolysing)